MRTEICYEFQCLKVPFGNSEEHGILCHVDIMTTKDYKRKKLHKEEARKLVIRLAAESKVLFSTHAIERMISRNIIQNDVMNVLLSSSMRISEGELEQSSFRYRCQTNRFVVVVSFKTHGDGVIVVTVWSAERKRK